MPPAAPTPQQRADFDYLVLTSLVLVSWELLVHFFQDLHYLRSKGWYRRPVIVANFLQRYGAFVVIVAEANIRLGRPSSCYAAGLVSLTVGGVVVLPAISLIYLFRVLAIWNKKPMVKYILGALWVVVWGASISAPFAQTAANLPTGGCTITRNESYTPAGFIANAIYDATVFILTAWRLISNRQRYKEFRSPVQTILLRDGILYFAVSVVVGITDIVFLEAVKSPVIASTVIPLHIALSSVMTTRLVNNVFHVVNDSRGVHMIPTNLASTDGTAKTSGLGSTPNRKGGAQSSTMLVVASGGDAIEDALNTKGQNMSTPTLSVRPQDGQNHTYAIPMQVRVTQDSAHVA